jgi:hypothetical protein
MKPPPAGASRFAARVWRNSLWALAIIAAALGAGIAGYVWFGPNDMTLARAFANAAMILSGMGPLDQLTGAGGYVFEGIYALVCGLLFFAVAGLVLAPPFHRLLRRFHLEDGGDQPRQ